MTEPAIAAIAVALALASCGGDDESTTKAGDPPEELLGTYAMTLQSSDLPPDPPIELTDSAEHWTLEITENNAVLGRTRVHDHQRRAGDAGELVC